MIPRGKPLEPRPLGSLFDPLPARVEVLNDGRAMVTIGRIACLYANAQRAREGVASLQRMGLVAVENEGVLC